MSIQILKENKINFNKQLLEWYSQHKRYLTFRKDKNPYKIMVSEIMAQQTQITTMERYFNRFLKRFPTIHDLALAKEEEVLSYWEGLGYYSRARNLHKASQIIDSNGEFPSEYDELIKLPGIGPYTAGAILSIAFNQKTPSVDGNALRVFARLYNLSDPINKQKTKTTINNIILDHLNHTKQYGDFNQAIMELGALICQKIPKCNVCPVNKYCLAYKEGNQNNLPVREKKLKKMSEYFDVLILMYKGKPLYQLRKKESLLSGLYGFPMKKRTNSEVSSISDLTNQFQVKEFKYVGNSKHIFTHKIWYSSIYIAHVNDIPSGLTDKPTSVPTAFKKMLELIKTN